ncbi:leptomycin B resistance protein pmd1 [Nannizzia gypsea CBS 118893]|uniref:Leptomycin B resistance protein pmd1 n=1 Tax=Arthroderma gypseum (strain ATCC MYA-4604 / CBS 118893) TaxID=535722 RepID=E4US67_ARTGP|nr:leptomycin B resistance protein pmd1 [Nannizzia gypsea CBS 118893]EFR00485.1 leptomycin B resistance protein pmd1 [Nannizzia gypsea CBS 118893]
MDGNNHVHKEEPAQREHGHDKKSPPVLSESEKEIVNLQLNGLAAELDTQSLWSYTTTWDKAIIVISVVAAILGGASNPLLTVVYGLAVGSFADRSNGVTSISELSAEVAKVCLYWIYLGIAMFFFIYITTVGFYYVGERIVMRLRYAYLRTILRQNIAFFDTLGAGDVTTCITSDMNLIQEGITSKVSMGLTAVATFFSAYTITYIQYWRLGLIMTSTVVVMLLTGTAGGILAVRYSKSSMTLYNSGSNLAEESIGSIRHVTAFGIQNTLANKYLGFLRQGEKPGIKARLAISFMISFMNGLPFLSYSLCFWQSGRYIISGHMSPGAAVTATMAIVIGGFAIGKVAPSLQSFMASTASASMIIRSMQRASPEDPMSNDGRKLEEIKGEVSFNDISLVYPSRQDVVVLKRVTLTMPAGKITAIVGPTGSGKSSIIGLVERFYRPTGGHITLDGHNIQDLNLRWLRSRLAYVGQEPILFNTTILENIGHGLAYLEDATRSSQGIKDAVIKAAKDANAHDFIMALPKGYDTVVGEKGLQLSGGQRQRIAIARALIRDPTILILDEATSALDSRAEKLVQKALTKAAKGRTTIVIAHRLSTIRSADNIVVLSAGEIAEQGDHDSLMARQGLYANLVNGQQLTEEKTEEDDDDALIENASASSWLMDEKATTKVQPEIVVEKKSDSKKFDKRLSFWDLLRLMDKLNRPERMLILLGFIGCVFAGLGTPVQAIFFAKLIEAVSVPASQYNKLRSETSFWASMYLMLGIVAIISWFGQGACFAFSSERLIRRAKDTTFRSILRQEVSFFDERPTGDLTTMLSQDTTHLGGLDGAVLGSMITFTVTIIGGLALSVAIGWKLGLVCAALIPITVGSGYIRLIILSLFDRKVRQTQAESAAYANEAVRAIRTVASLGLENEVLQRYRAILERDAAASLRSILWASVLFALSQSLLMPTGALVFWYSSTLLATGEYTLTQCFICFSALVTGAQTAGAVFNFAPDMSKAMQAGRHLRNLFERVPPIDSYSSEGRLLPAETCRGAIEIQDVSYRYPQRPERVVLANFSLSIKSGQFVALVGPSGCGKSTVLALLERFFDPDIGHIRVDGSNITELNISQYRSRIAMVGQEPVVYSGTIRENLVLGASGNVTEEAIAQACKDANIYEFIKSLPDGFATVVGAQGSMLSGGQKQRVAIARALLRNPKMLLLDEATSALDSQSERIVQEALDRAAKGRTTISVAHRLSTIKRADLICVMDQGKLVEKGTHEQLMAKREMYYDLVQAQNLDTGP